LLRRGVPDDLTRRFNFHEQSFRTGQKRVTGLNGRIVNFCLVWNSTLRELSTESTNGEFPTLRSEREQPLRNFWWPQALICMDNFEHREKPPITKEEREAKKQRARQEGELALAARKKEDAAFRANFERLKAERMAREAAETKS
jgi:hypothetical protein